MKSSPKLFTALAALIVCMSVAVSAGAQTSGSSTDGSGNASSQTVLNNANPVRTTENHVKSGNRTLDTKTLEVLDTDGQYHPYLRTETETIQESATATRSTVRTYAPGGDREEHLTQVVETESQNSSDGGAHTVRTTSSPDGEGNFHVAQREVATTTVSPGSKQTQTTIYFPNVEGKLAPGVQIHEQEDRRADGNVESRKTTLMPDGAGNWQVYEVRQQTVKGDAENRTTEERTSRRDFEGNISPVSQVITKEKNSKDVATTSTETSSLDVAGSARDGALHPVSQTTTVQKTEGGRTVTERVDQPDPGNPPSYFTPVVKTMDVSVAADSGTEQTITVTAQYPDGSPSVVSIETRKSDQPSPKK